MKRREEKISRRKKVAFVVLLTILALILIQASLIGIQSNRYHFKDEGYDDYACVQMSRDCEIFFEDHGITVYQITGKQEIETNDDTSGPETKWHRWIMLDFGLIQVTYESTALCLGNPEWFGYTALYISDGYVINGRHFNETQLIWADI